MRAIEQRLAKLEQDAPAVAVCFIWADIAETADQAVARQFPDGPPDNSTVTVFRFAETPDDGGGRPG
jgi:hypothetical protein